MYFAVQAARMPELREPARTTGSSQTFASFSASCTWTCGGSCPTLLKMKNLYRSILRTVGDIG
jgi:hypothetical protein